MADDERLREALLELQVLRDREASVLRETQALLTCIERFTAADTPDAAFDSLFASVRDLLDGAILVLVEEALTASQADILRAGVPDLIGASLTTPINLFRKPRNIVDSRMAGDWVLIGAEIGFRSVLIVPLRNPIPTAKPQALLAFSTQRGAFARNDLQVLQRLGGLASQALASEALTRQNRLLAATVEGSSSGFSISDARSDGDPLVYVNPAFEALSGYSLDEAIGRNCRFLNVEPAQSSERLRLRDTVAKRGEGRFLLRNRRKDGTEFWNDLTLFPVRDASGQITNLVATQTDATNRVEAELERDELRTQMETVLRTTRDAVLLLDGDAKVLYANAAVSDYFPSKASGWARGTTFSENWSAYLDGFRGAAGAITSLLRQADLEALASVPDGQELNLPDGRYLLVRARKVDDGNTVITGTNITPLKTAESLLQQRIAAIEAATDGIAIVDERERFLYVNASAATLLGFSDTRLALGRKWKTRYSDVTEGDGNGIFKLREDPKQTHELRMSSLPGAGGVLTIRDVTARLEAEARAIEMQQALSQAQRQEALSQLAAGIAHDFNNLLSAINGSAALISMEGEINETTRGHADRITAAGTRAARLVNRLLDLGGGARRDSTFELRQALADLTDMVGPSLPQKVILNIDLGQESLIAVGDPGEVSQIAVNLILNARDALTDDGGYILVSVGSARVDRARELTVGLLSAGRSYACIAVQDTGAGIPDDVLAQIFDPYFSTKGAQGTGLGLAMVATQVRAAGGGIDVQTQAGHGTTFYVYWPIRGADAEPDADTNAVPADALRGRTILVVDDDTEVSAVVQAYLEGLGAEVATCDDARDAAEAVSEDPSAWSALVTDYDMPEMNGGALVDHVRQITDDLPIFVITALARRLTDPRVTADRISGLFAKPVDLGQLAQALVRTTTAPSE